MNKIKGLALLLLTIGIWSCTKDEDKSVLVNLEMVVGEESLGTATTYNIDGVDVQFTNVAFYLGDMTFKNSNGSNFVNQGDDRYQLVTPGKVEYAYTIPYSEETKDVTLDEISFILGVDAETNNDDQTTFEMRPDGDPLGQQNPTMHWGWMGKYRFLNIDAEIDADGNGVFGEEDKDEKLTYHLGKDSFLGNIKLTPNQKLEGGENEYRLTFDLEKLLDGVDLKTEQFTKTGADQIEVANKIFANYNTAFTFEK